MEVDIFMRRRRMYKRTYQSKYLRAIRNDIFPPECLDFSLWSDREVNFASKIERSSVCLKEAHICPNEVYLELKEIKIFVSNVDCAILE